LLLSFCHLGFSKIGNFNGLFPVKQLLRYEDLTVFPNGGRPPSWILEIQLFNGLGGKKTHNNHAKFHEDRPIRCCVIAIFVIFKMAAAAILVFEKFEILTVV